MLKKILVKTAKILGISAASLLALMFLLPVLFPETIAGKIKDWANGSIKGEMNFSKARLSFFKHFPSLTLTLYDFALKGSAPFQKDTLAYAKELGLGVDLASIFGKTLSIDKIYFSTGNIHIHVDGQGRANYNVYQSSSATTKDAPDTSSTSLALKKIQIDDCNLVYDDASIPMMIAANGLHYTGSGDLSKSLFDLSSHIAVDSFNLSYDHTSYILSKRLEGDLVTKINTSSLEFIFEKNDLKINALPVSLHGRFGFLNDGYFMDFKLRSLESGLHDVLTALPPEYLHWLEKTDVKGFADVYATLSGNYIASTGEMPSLAFNMKIRDGYIRHDKAPTPIEHLFLDFKTSIPKFNLDSFYVNVDSLFFNMDKDYLSLILKLKNVNTPEIYAKMQTDLDLEKWNAATGMDNIHFKGRLNAELLADGLWKKGIVYKGNLRKKTDTAIVSIPKFRVSATLQNGYVKIDTLPNAIDKLNFRLTAACPDSQMKNIYVSLDDINAEAMGSFVRGYFHANKIFSPILDANIQSNIRLQDVKKYYPLPTGTDIAGDLHINAFVKGKMDLARRSMPVTTVYVKLDNGMVKTDHAPESIKDINIDATIMSKTASLHTLSVVLKPISFSFAGQPFMLKADLKNFDNLKYRVYSKGNIDIGKIYTVFGSKDFDVTGKIYTNLSLNGSQADATAGRYQMLDNKGTLQMDNIKLSSELFPYPFKIVRGLFRFDQDKMWFEKFNATYAKNNVTLDGYLYNAIGYATQKNQTLNGNFHLHSPKIVADDFMFFADATDKNKTSQSNTNNSSGVIMVPDNLDLAFRADIKTLLFKGVPVKNIGGGMKVSKNTIRLDSLNFEMVGAPVAMQARYTSLQPSKATFDYHIAAKEFDIKRAYTEVPFFREMMTSAKGAEGIVGLDYTLSGRLDKDMNPIMKSLAGGGVLSVKKVKMKGFKLFNAVSKSTDKDKIKDPDISKIDIKSTIKNNILTIERTKLKVAGFRPRFEGQISLDGRLNLNARLGLPPFGILGIPFTVTGTQENPKIHLRRGKDADKLEEEADEEKEED
ncbi:MAG: AsmA-like C-terminal region-containing protein [Chitinophagaceae bacterium]